MSIFYKYFALGVLFLSHSFYEPDLCFLGPVKSLSV